MKQLRNIILSSVLVIIIAQSLNFVLGISSFENFYRNLLIAKYKIINKEMRSQIETGINFGKPLYKFNGMDAIFQKILALDNEIKNIQITDTNGVILYSLDAQNIGKRSKLQYVKFSTKNLSEVKNLSKGDLIYSILPIFENDGNNKRWIGNTYLAFNETIIRVAINKIIGDNTKKFLVFLSSAILVVILLLWLVTIYHEKRDKNKIKISLKNKHFVVIVLILVSSQLFFSFSNNRYYEKVYLEMINTNLKSFSRIMSKNIEFYTNLGLKITKLKKAEDLLFKRLKEVPECQEICITDSKGRVLYKADNKEKNSILEVDSVLFKNSYKIDLSNLDDQSYRQIVEINKNDDTIGYIVFLVNKKLIDSKLLDLLMDALTVMAVSLIFSFEILVLFSFCRKKHEEDEKDIKTIEENNIKLIRLTSFIFFLLS